LRIKGEGEKGRKGEREKKGGAEKRASELLMN